MHIYLLFLAPPLVPQHPWTPRCYTNDLTIIIIIILTPGSKDPLGLKTKAKIKYHRWLEILEIIIIIIIIRVVFDCTNGAQCC